MHRDLLLLFISAVPNTKVCAWGEEDSGGQTESVLFIDTRLSNIYTAEDTPAVCYEI